MTVPWKRLYPICSLQTEEKCVKPSQVASEGNNLSWISYTLNSTFCSSADHGNGAVDDEDAVNSVATFLSLTLTE